MNTSEHNCNRSNHLSHTNHLSKSTGVQKISTRPIRFQKRSVNLLPNVTLLGRVADGIDELHAAHNFDDAREVEFQGRRLPLRRTGADRVAEVLVVVGKRLQERFGMPVRRARATRGGGALRGDVAVPALPDFLRRLLVEDAQVVRIFLIPAERLLLAVDPDVQVVFLARRDLRRGEGF